MEGRRILLGALDAGDAHRSVHARFQRHSPAPHAPLRANSARHARRVSRWRGVAASWDERPAIAGPLGAALTRISGPWSHETSFRIISAVNCPGMMAEKMIGACTLDRRAGGVRGKPG